MRGGGRAIACTHETVLHSSSNDMSYSGHDSEAAAWQALSMALSRVTHDVALTHSDAADVSSDTRAQWCAALRGVVDASTCHRFALAQLLVQCLFDAFAPALRDLDEDMAVHCVSSGDDKDATTMVALACAALQRLHSRYTRVQPLLCDVDACVCASGAAEQFAVRLRGALLQSGVCGVAQPRVTTRSRTLLSSVYAHAHALLSSRDAHGTTAMDDDGDEEVAAATAATEGVAGATTLPSLSMTHDAMLRCLHGLTLSRATAVRHVWREALSRSLDARVAAALEADDYAGQHLQACLTWAKTVVEPFVRVTLAAPLPRARDTPHEHRNDNISDDDNDDNNDDDNDDDAAMQWRGWRVRVQQMLLRRYARMRMAHLWYALVDYPDSCVALAELRYCLQTCSDGAALKQTLVQTVRGLLATRLHRAGTRTEDMVAVLSKTVQALCVLLPRSEQGVVVLAVVSDTLRQLRARADCVATLVRAITSSSGDASLFARAAPPSRLPAPITARRYEDDVGECNKNADDDDDDDDDECATTVGGGGSTGTMAAAAALTAREADVRSRPDVLRVLLTAVPARMLAHECRYVLAEQLLSRPLHSFDVMAAEEVHERLRCALGEDALGSCDVMLNDVKQSRLVTLQLREQLAAAAAQQQQQQQRGQQQQHRSAPSRRDSDAERSGSEDVGRGAVCMTASLTSPSLSSPPTQGSGDTEGDDVAAVQLSVDVLSASAWPRLAQQQQQQQQPYTPHPLLQGYMTLLAQRYSAVKPRRKLLWLLSHGRVELELQQPQQPPQPLPAQQRSSRTPGTAVTRDDDDDDDDDTAAAAGVAHAPSSPTCVSTSHTLSLMAASIVLWVRDLSRAASHTPLLQQKQQQQQQPLLCARVRVAEVAQRMCVSVQSLLPHIRALTPHILAHGAVTAHDTDNDGDDDSNHGRAAAGGGGGGGWVSLQTMSATTTARTRTTRAAAATASSSSTMVCFDDDDGVAASATTTTTSAHAQHSANGNGDNNSSSSHSGRDGDAAEGVVVAGVTAEQLRMLQMMVQALLKTSGPKTVADIRNSMKLFGSFAGSVADMRRVLRLMVAQGTLTVSTDGKLYMLQTTN